MDGTNDRSFNYKEPYKREPNKEPQNCFCCDSDEDSIDRIRFEHAKEKCVQKCFRICLLLCIIIGYSFIGSVIFITIEDNSYDLPQPLAPLAISEKSAQPNDSMVRWLKKAGAENRDRTVQKIWDITVNLNILYKDNWTRLAAKELNHFQERLLDLLWQEKLFLEPPVFSEDTQKLDEAPTHWKLGKAFLYSISLLATIGYGNSLSRSSSNKLITMIYAILGMPVMFMYLSSVGSLLSTCAQHVFSRTLCCCLCSKCGYCCYDEKLMKEKEKRMRKKREVKEYREKMGLMSEPFFVGTSSLIEMQSLDVEKQSSDTQSVDSRINNGYSRFLAPLLVCISFTIIYILLGSLVLYNLEDCWRFLDGVYFCFMLITATGMGDTVPLSSALSPYSYYSDTTGVFLVWFFSTYILIGLSFSATCLSIIHDGIRHKITDPLLCSEETSKSKQTSGTNSKESTNIS